MAKRQEIPDILAQERQRINVLDDVLSGKPVGPGLQATEIRIADIRRDGATQPRSGLDAQHVEDLIQALTDGATLPAIDVMFDGTFYWLYDGFHRTAAHERLGHTKIAAIVHQGAQEDAQWESYAANKSHGLKRSNEDKKRQVLAALRHPKAPTLSNRELARHVGVDEGTIRYYRTQLESTAEIPQSTTRIGADGRTINTAKIGSNQPQRNTLESSVPAANVVPSAATGSRQQGAQLAICRICHRPLSDPDSAANGIGPCCAGKQVTAAGSGTVDDDDEDEQPLQVADVDDILTPDRHEVSSPTQQRNTRIDSVLRRLYAARDAIGEFEELTGAFTLTPAFRRSVEAMVSALEGNRV